MDDDNEWLAVAAAGLVQRDADTVAAAAGADEELPGIVDSSDDDIEPPHVLDVSDEDIGVKQNRKSDVLPHPSRRTRSPHKLAASRMRQGRGRERLHRAQEQQTVIAKAIDEINVGLGLKMSLQVGAEEAFMRKDYGFSLEMANGQVRTCRIDQQKFDIPGDA